MAIKVDFDKAKQKAIEEAARTASFGAFSAIKWWKPKKGKNRFRIMPPWTEEGVNAFQWWREVWMHWNIGIDEDSKQSLSCPKKTPPGGEVCPICQESEKLSKTGDPADLEMAKQIRAKVRFYANIIDLKDPIWTDNDVEELISAGTDESKLPKVGDPKIQVFSFGSTIFKQLLDYFADKVDLTHLDKGSNIVLTKENEGINTDYRVRPEQDPSRAPVPDDDPILNNLDALMVVRPISEIKAIMQGIDPEEMKKLEAAQVETQKRQKKLIAAKLAQEEAEETFEEEDTASNVEEDEPEDTPKEEKPVVAKPKVVIPKKPVPQKIEVELQPLDDEGYIDFNKVTDDDIENPENERYKGEGGGTVYVSCFGAAKEWKEKDSGCLECPLYRRCGDRMKSLDAKKDNGKRPVGRPPGKKVETQSGVSPEIEELEAQMREAIKSRR